MSSNKRVLDWPGVTGSSNSSNKRAKFPAPQTRINNMKNPNQFSDIQVPSVSSSTNPLQRTLRTHATGSALLSALKASMDLVRQGSGAVFPQLASAAEGLLETLEAVDVSA